MNDDEIRVAHAAIVARENAWVRMINSWRRNRQTATEHFMRSVPVPDADRSDEDDGFPVLFENF